MKKLFENLQVFYNTFPGSANRKYSKTWIARYLIGRVANKFAKNNEY